jgi:uncharacterized protein YecA (UPF0149 family)
VGVIADSIVAYAQPLLEETDGSIGSMNRAMSIAQICWNLALLPEDKREAALDDMKPTLKMTDEEYADFRQNLILPMIHRHHKMFPGLHNRSKPRYDAVDVASPPAKKHPGTDRYAPCPCGSGRKYKFCCGAK